MGYVKHLTTGFRRSLRAWKMRDLSNQRLTNLRNDCIVLLYIDDMIALTRNERVSEKLVNNLKNSNYILTDEGSLTKNLGVDVRVKHGGYIELMQPFLIQRIIDLLGIEGESVHNTKPTPSVLHKDL